MFDLLKNVTATHHVDESVRPQGWNVFLKFLASNNIPLSAIPNKQLRQTVDMYKYMPSPKGDYEAAAMPGSSGKRSKRNQTLPSITSPGMPIPQWVPY